MSKLIRRTVKKRGTALIVALQLTGLTFLSLVSFVHGPQQSANPPADSQISVGQDQTQPALPFTAADLAAADKAGLLQSAHFAVKLQEPRASQVFNLATQRAATVRRSHNLLGPEQPNDGPTLTTDQQDYPPFSYVTFTGTGFQPGETVDMIVVETDPIQQSFEPWQVIADENGNFATSWYVFSTDFEGATFQATATGQTSQLTASATFTDAAGDGTMTVTPAAAQPNSTGNSFTFSFRNVNQTYNGSSSAHIVVSAAAAPGWTTPQNTNSGNPGFVSVTPFGTGSIASIASITGTSPGPYTITVNFTTTTVSGK